MSIPGRENVCVPEPVVYENETCEGFNEMTGKPYPKCAEGLYCEPTWEVSIPGAGNTCVSLNYFWHDDPHYVCVVYNEDYSHLQYDDATVCCFEGNTGCERARPQSISKTKYFVGNDGTCRSSSSTETLHENGMMTSMSSLARPLDETCC